jgi:hypothetical protein
MALTKVGAGVLNIDDLYGFRNRIINGDMRIDQRNAGASVTITNTSALTYTADRWGAFGSVTSKFSVQQSSVAPSGYSNSLAVTSASAYTVGASEVFKVTQLIEGFNCADFGFGSAGASTVTLSFWVRSSLTGTFGGAILNSAFNRNYPFTYTINAANTWEQKTVIIAGDTTGTWLTTNGIGLQVVWSLGSGSSISGTAGVWGSGNIQSATGTVSVVGTNGATFFITGVQLEKGTVATPFERRPFGTELALCQRYFQIYRGNTTNNLNDGSLINLPNWSTTEAIGAFVFPQMRASPTFSFSALSGFRYFTAGSVFTPGSILLNGANVNRLEIYVTPSSGSWTIGNSGFFRIHTSSDFLSLSAEI